MARVVVVNHVTLDGAMQAPGRPDEDRRAGSWPRRTGNPFTPVLDARHEYVVRLTSASSTANGVIVTSYEKEESR